MLLYLIEGFKEAAEIFAGEAGIPINNVDLTSVDERLKIREAIENGKIQDAISLINKKAPELLDQNKQLAFHLKVIFHKENFLFPISIKDIFVQKKRTYVFSE